MSAFLTNNYVYLELIIFKQYELILEEFFNQYLNIFSKFVGPVKNKYVQYSQFNGQNLWCSETNLLHPFIPWLVLQNEEHAACC